MKELDNLKAKRAKLIDKLTKLDDKIYHIIKPGFKIPLKGFRK